MYVCIYLFIYLFGQRDLRFAYKETKHLHDPNVSLWVHFRCLAYLSTFSLNSRRQCSVGPTLCLAIPLTLLFWGTPRLISLPFKCADMKLSSETGSDLAALPDVGAVGTGRWRASWAVFAAISWRSSRWVKLRGWKCRRHAGCYGAIAKEQDRRSGSRSGTLPS